MKTRYEIEDCFRDIAPELQKIRNVLFDSGIRTVNLNIDTIVTGSGMFVTEEKGGMWAMYSFDTDGYVMQNYEAKLLPS